jgi:hypothetical protein
MTIPLYGFLEGDTIGLLLLVQEEDQIEHLVTKLQNAASVRVAPQAGFGLWFDGKRLDPNASVKEAKLAPLDVVHVRRVVPGEGLS